MKKAWRARQSERLGREIERMHWSEDSQRTMDELSRRVVDLVEQAFATSNPEGFLEAHLMTGRGPKKQYVPATITGSLELNIQILQSLIKTEQVSPSDDGIRLSNLKRTLAVHDLFLREIRQT